VSYRTALLVGIFVFLLKLAASAQISPGPLSRAHKSLEGSSQCTSCHKVGSGRELKCLDCHTEIARRLAEGRGLHATYKLKAGSSQECARCHSDHNGVDFPLVKWDVGAFDHRQAGYALEGKHAGLSCNRCHSADKVLPTEKSAVKYKDLNKTFLGLSPACASCHEDPHKGRLGQTCQQCHDNNDWKQVSDRQFDHAKTRYPLTGLHAQVACQKCHTPGAEGKPRYWGIAFGKCADCHVDVHKGSFAQQSCQLCHSTSGWKRVTAVLSESFDHARTKYPLLGKHQQVDCLQCHSNGDFKKPLVFAKCMDCHKDDHGGQFVKRADKGECASCHNVEGFKPALFGVKEHAASAYPLQAKHATVECAKCHIPKGKETLYRIRFARCLDCHQDEHQMQFAAAPYGNRCEQCHTLNGFRPSTYTLATHKEARFVLTGGHLAVACGDCHKPRGRLLAKPAAVYQFDDRSCTGCHADPHKGQFAERMRLVAAEGKAGCESCHTTLSWRELSRFDHGKTQFPLVGTHRGVACIDCHKPANMETTLIHVDFKAAPLKCEDCHGDIHGAQFAKAGITACADCHNSMKWKPSLFDHDARTGFPLQGLHRNVRCAGCHKLTRRVGEESVLFYKPTPKECAACHGGKALETATAAKAN
jgi:hypothetical protein